jgi:hypothetical protein
MTIWVLRAFLSLLPPRDAGPIRLKQVLHKNGERLQAVYFPNGGVASITTLLLACNVMHQVPQRSARRLLMTHDRMHEQDFNLRAASCECYPIIRADFDRLHS